MHTVSALPIPLLVFLPACGQVVDESFAGMGWDVGEKATVCSSGGSYTTIQAAINAASSGGTITVCAGTYKERLTVAGKTVTLTGAGFSTTILDADNSGSALKVTGGGKVTLSGMTVTKAKTGGLYCKDATLVVSDSAITANKSSSAGGGLYSFNCAITVSGVSFSSNTSSSRGAGIYAESCSGAISNSTFSANLASSKGGGVALKSGTVTIDGNTFTGNSGTHGGGAYVEADSDVTDNAFAWNTSIYHGGGAYSAAGDGDYTGNTFTDNYAGEDGGGLYINVSYAYVADNVFEGNDAFDDGGGLRALTSYPTIERNTFDSNTAGDSGGGVKLSHKYGTFTDNVVIDNVAVTTGGGMYLDEDTTVVSGCTFEGNNADIGGGLYQAGGWRLAEIEDTEFIDNTAATKGGGLAVSLSAYGVQTVRTTFSANTAGYGAAIHSDGSKLRIHNTLLHWNTATASGGGLYALSGDTDVLNSVFYRNAAPWASAIYAYNLTGAGVHNSIFYKNNTGAATVVGAGSLTWKYNDHYNQSSGDFSGMSDPTGTNGNLAVYPEFGDASEGDFVLEADSPLRNAGDPSGSYYDVDGSRNDMGIFGGPVGSW